MKRREFVLSVAAAIPFARSRAQTIRLTLPDSAPDELQAALRFGLDDAGRAAALLGRPIETAAATRVTITPSADIAIAGARFTTGGSRDAIDQLLHAARKAGVAGNEARVVEWHPSLRRFGASELNQRFRRATGRPMSALHWRGWFAVKAIVETALRNADSMVSAETLTALRFDGHKGHSLTFDAESRALRQALYVEQRGRIVWPPQP